MEQGDGEGNHDHAGDRKIDIHDVLVQGGAVEGGAILPGSAANKKSALMICMIDANDDGAWARGASGGYLREADYAFKKPCSDARSSA
ncbi:hypothetical protein KTQ74_06615 [Pseudomonas chlororaphis]|uniref:hypothetical protein n=1 Tax=Pseudomonas chlororaphis TaxID=587753 RepID=UPI001E498C0E|nr:hypothetical protein [Pseudomonas chlororaphis]MCB2251560.1 hypothetical protein [Pseudomonas chlororaphis]